MEELESKIKSLKQRLKTLVVSGDDLASLERQKDLVEAKKATIKRLQQEQQEIANRRNAKTGDKAGLNSRSKEAKDGLEHFLTIGFGRAFKSWIPISILVAIQILTFQFAPTMPEGEGVGIGIVMTIANVVIVMWCMSYVRPSDGEGRWIRRTDPKDKNDNDPYHMLLMIMAIFTPVFNLAWLSTSSFAPIAMWAEVGLTLLGYFVLSAQFYWVWFVTKKKFLKRYQAQLSSLHRELELLSGPMENIEQSQSNLEKKIEQEKRSLEKAETLFSETGFRISQIEQTKNAVERKIKNLTQQLKSEIARAKKAKEQERELEEFRRQSEKQRAQREEAEKRQQQARAKEEKKRQEEADRQQRAKEEKRLAEEKKRIAEERERVRLEQERIRKEDEERRRQEEAERQRLEMERLRIEEEQQRQREEQKRLKAELIARRNDFVKNFEQKHGRKGALKILEFFEEDLHSLDRFKALIVGTAKRAEREQLKVFPAFDSDSFEQITSIRIALVHIFDECRPTFSDVYLREHFESDLAVLLGEDAVLVEPVSEVDSWPTTGGLIEFSNNSLISTALKQSLVPEARNNNGNSYFLPYHFAELMFALRLKLEVDGLYADAAKTNPYINAVLPRNEFEERADKILLEWENPVEHFAVINGILDRTLKTVQTTNRESYLNDEELVLRRSAVDDLKDYFVERALDNDFIQYQHLEAFVISELVEDVSLVDLRKKVANKKDEIDKHILKHRVRRRYRDQRDILATHYAEPDFEKDLVGIDLQLTMPAFQARIAMLEGRIERISKPLRERRDQNATKEQQEKLAAQMEQQHKEQEQEYSNKIWDFLQMQRKAADTDSDLKARHEQLIERWRQENVQV
ncbi:MAG: hypothetical protein AAFN77_02960 [Planctomycetota bacterium]